MQWAPDPMAGIAQGLMQRYQNVQNRDLMMLQVTNQDLQSVMQQIQTGQISPDQAGQAYNAAVGAVNAARTRLRLPAVPGGQTTTPPQGGVALNPSGQSGQVFAPPSGGAFGSAAPGGAATPGTVASPASPPSNAPTGLGAVLGRMFGANRGPRRYRRSNRTP